MVHGKAVMRMENEGGKHTSGKHEAVGRKREGRKGTREEGKDK